MSSSGTTSGDNDRDRVATTTTTIDLEDILSSGGDGIATEAPAATEALPLSHPPHPPPGQQQQRQQQQQQRQRGGGIGVGQFDDVFYENLLFAFGEEPSTTTTSDGTGRRRGLSSGNCNDVDDDDGGGGIRTADNNKNNKDKKRPRRTERDDDAAALAPREEGGVDDDDTNSSATRRRSPTSSRRKLDCDGGGGGSGSATTTAAAAAAASKSNSSASAPPAVMEEEGRAEEETGGGGGCNEGGGELTHEWMDEGWWLDDDNGGVVVVAGSNEAAAAALSAATTKPGAALSAVTPRKRCHRGILLTCEGRTVRVRVGDVVRLWQEVVVAGASGAIRDASATAAAAATTAAGGTGKQKTEWVAGWFCLVTELWEETAANAAGGASEGGEDGEGPPILFKGRWFYLREDVAGDVKGRRVVQAEEGCVPVQPNRTSTLLARNRDIAGRWKRFSPKWDKVRRAKLLSDDAANRKESQEWLDSFLRSNDLLLSKEFETNDVSSIQDVIPVSYYYNSDHTAKKSSSTPGVTLASSATAPQLWEPFLCRYKIGNDDVFSFFRFDQADQDLEGWLKAASATDMTGGARRSFRTRNEYDAASMIGRIPLSSQLPPQLSVEGYHHEWLGSGSPDNDNSSFLYSAVQLTSPDGRTQIIRLGDTVRVFGPPEEDWHSSYYCLVTKLRDLGECQLPQFEGFLFFTSENMAENFAENDLGLQPNELVSTRIECGDYLACIEGIVPMAYYEPPSLQGSENSMSSSVKPYVCRYCLTSAGTDAMNWKLESRGSSAGKALLPTGTSASARINVPVNASANTTANASSPPPRPSSSPLRQEVAAVDRQLQKVAAELGRERDVRGFELEAIAATQRELEARLFKLKADLGK